MDLYIILTWVITLLTIVSVVAFLYVKRIIKEKRVFSTLQSFALENNSTISRYDYCDKTLIGIDNQGANKLFFVRTIVDKKTNSHKEFREVINLTEVINCRLEKAVRTVQLDKEKVKVIDKIELIFSLVCPNKLEVILEFYNNDYDNLMLSGELQLARKWAEIVNYAISVNKIREFAVDHDSKIFPPHALHSFSGHKRVIWQLVRKRTRDTAHEIAF